MPEIQLIPPVSLTPPPPVPALSEGPSAFPIKAYNFTNWEANALYPGLLDAMGNIHNNAGYAAQMAGQASVHAQAAASRVDDVNAAASAAMAAVSFRGEWSALSGALAMPAVVLHRGRFWFLKSNLADVTAAQPGVASAYWGEMARNDLQILPCPAGETIAADRCIYLMTSPNSVLKLPPDPWPGFYTGAINASGTLKPVVKRNGKRICGDAEDYRMNVLGWDIAWQYDDATGNWVRMGGATAHTVSQAAISQANIWSAPQNFTDGLLLNGENAMTSGSNPNGRWVRYADGTQMCWYTYAMGARTWAASEGLGVGAWSFPQPFWEVPNVMVQNDSAYGVAFTTGTEGVRTTGVDMIHLRNASSGAVPSVINRVMMTAIGRYK